MKIHRSTSKDTAIRINILDTHEAVDDVITRELGQLFGNRDGDYFVHSSEKRTIISGRVFMLLLVEDKDEDRHMMYFELVKGKQ